MAIFKTQALDKILRSRLDSGNTWSRKQESDEWTGDFRYVTKT